MIELEIQNFQAIEKVSLQISGFTALVGRSNIGKSAIVRAIRSALTGASGTDFVRHGQQCERLLKGVKKCKCKASVRIKTEALHLLWEKGDNDNQYTVWKDGEKHVYNSVGSGTPDFLLPEFGMVEVGGSKQLLQVADQFEPIFLLNQTGPATADVLSDVTKLDAINIASSLAEKDRREAASTRKVREKDVAALAQQLEAYASVDAVAARVRDVEGAFSKTSSMQVALDRISRFLVTLADIARALQSLKTALAPALPNLEGLAAMSASFTLLAALFEQVAERAPVVRRLSGVAAIALPDVDRLRKKSELLDSLTAWHAQYESLSNAVLKHSGVDQVALSDSEGLTRKAVEFNRLTAWYQRLASIKEGLVSHQAVDGVRDVELPNLKVLDRLTTLETLTLRQSKLQEALPELEQALSEADRAEAEVLAAFEALGVCPTCSQDIAPGHLHKRAS